MSNEKKIRADCKDVWNAFMVKGAKFSENGISFCPSTVRENPQVLISYTEARATYNRQMNQDDYKFDGKRCRIWVAPEKAKKIFRYFAGIITPDFSTNLDFPFPWKIFNTYRMRAFGYWYGTLGNAVINNVRWGEKDTFDRCFEGIQHNNIVSIGTVGCIKEKYNLRRFAEGLEEMIRRLTPKIILVYGSAPSAAVSSQLLAVRKNIKAKS